MLQKAIPILAYLNAEETIKYYTEKLGFTCINTYPAYLIFGRDTIVIHLWLCDDPEIPKATGCYVLVTDIDDLYKEYQQQDIIHPNAPLKDTPWGMRQFSVLDNSGNIFNFGQQI
ncbi:VOC family protein [Mucilaginibacter limnophilus]|uniref:Bleomycin resistance protein n=1 Tax=Mucilaginibacter limnophilus TaxID=1932778 RepID=A0A437MVP0_9SPHI|nr:VOC family protein [Mucilaginibacter limnophilus]RVU01740.1 VOC family protein [Mucilaginibacter limnophilus]